MKLVIDGKEIEIKVKDTCNGLIPKQRASESDTMSFLNYIAVLAGAASEWYSRVGADALAELANRTQNEIFNVLDAKGLYNEFK